MILIYLQNNPKNTSAFTYRLNRMKLNHKYNRGKRFKMTIISQLLSMEITILLEIGRNYVTMFQLKQEWFLGSKKWLNFIFHFGDILDNLLSHYFAKNVSFWRKMEYFKVNYLQPCYASHYNWWFRFINNTHCKHSPSKSRWCIDFEYVWIIFSLTCSYYFYIN